MPAKITAIKAFNDNYIWLAVNPEKTQALCVDPGDATPVIEVIDAQGLDLTAILITHHHFDHTGGIKQLKQRFPKARVYGPNDSRIQSVDSPLDENDRLTLENFDLNFEIISTPGHTSQHLCYFDPQGLLFCGDTLFSAGCGRLFEGTAEQMHASLSKLAKLPEKTRVYCTHEYTLSNIAFALSIDPDNSALVQYRNKIQSVINSGGCSLPSTIATERAINPFLRCDSEAIKRLAFNHYGQEVNEEEIFRLIRQLKDNF